MPAEGYLSCMQEEAAPLMLGQKVALPDGQHIDLSNAKQHIPKSKGCRLIDAHDWH